MDAKKFNTTDDYIASFPSGAVMMLTELRGLVRNAAPVAVEVISYNMPAFKLHGRILCYYAAHSSHIGFYPADARIIEQRKEELKGYATSKGTIRFPLGKPLPAELVTSIIRQRVVDIEMKVLRKK